MGGGNDQVKGPDFSAGVDAAEVKEGALLAGHVDGAPVIVTRCGREVLAIGGKCTHYGAPLSDGLVVGDTVRCPWHHACFSLRTGEALRAPALDPVAAFATDEREGKVFVLRSSPAVAGAQAGAAASSGAPPAAAPESVVIIGAGAAGNAAAEMLRRRGYAGPISMIGTDPSGPYDRPNLSKDYLAGTAPEEWIALRPPEFYRDRGIELTLGITVDRIDPRAKTVSLSSGATLPYGALLLATGADPVRLTFRGSDLPQREVPAIARGQPRDHLPGFRREAGGGHRRELHRARGRRRSPGARRRSHRRGTRGAASRSRPR